MISNINKNPINSKPFLEILSKLIVDKSLDPAYLSLFIDTTITRKQLLQTIFDSGNVPDPDEIFLALEDMERRIAKKLINQLTNLYEDLTIHTEL